MFGVWFLLLLAWSCHPYMLWLEGAAVCFSRVPRPPPTLMLGWCAPLQSKNITMKSIYIIVVYLKCVSKKYWWKLYTTSLVIQNFTNTCLTRSMSDFWELGHTFEKWATGTRHRWTRTENMELMLLQQQNTGEGKCNESGNCGCEDQHSHWPRRSR